MNSYEYINEVKRTNGLDTDYKVAKMLGWANNKITQYKNGQSMDNNAAREIAEILNIPVWQIIADMEAQRAKDEPTRKAWKMLAKLPKEAGSISTKLLFTLPFLSYLVANTIYYVKYSAQEQYAY